MVTEMLELKRYESTLKRNTCQEMEIVPHAHLSTATYKLRVSASPVRV